MIFILCIASVVFALGYALFNFRAVKKLSEGTKEMQEIAAHIRSGSFVFLKEEYKILLIIAAVVFFGIIAFIHWSTGIAFLIGLAMSTCPCWIGMITATYANVRVTNTARTTNRLSTTLQVAIRAASVMGLSVAAFSILGFLIVYAIFHGQLSTLDIVKNWIGLEFRPFSMTATAYSFGCSFIAIFARIGGGIYTKAADMGADLVGKYEMDIPEDDARNPATIADNVGDNVNDVAGLGSDLLESNVGAIISAVLFALTVSIDVMARSGLVNVWQVQSLYLYAVGVAALGLISCTIGIFIILHRNMSNTDPQKDLNSLSTISASLVVVTSLIYTLVTFNNFSFSALNFNLGILSPWVCILCGILSGIIIGKVSEYYTSYAYSPTQQLAESAKEGAAIVITKGDALGKKSTLATVVIIVIALLISSSVAGTFGVALAAVGMLSFVGTTVTIDSYGPISDNAGGIAEMAHLPASVREITDMADAAGNTTAAIGKGFAIGSAAFATLSLIMNYVSAYTPIGQDPVLNMVNPLVISGLLLGGALPYYFSGLLTDEVSKAANIMVLEVRRQFAEIKGLREGKVKPDYDKCIQISSSASLKGMKIPAILPIAFSVGGGLLLGPDFVGALLIGATVVAVPLAIECGNSGGAWDNAKKFIETGGIPGEGKGSPAHHAAIVGDTVGDPKKDTVGPSLDIMIKIMSTVSLITVTIYNFYNLYSWIQSLLPNFFI